MTPERKQRIDEVLRRRQPDLCVVTDKIVKDRNLAAIIRTCDAVGVQDVHCVVTEMEYRSYRGTSASADKFVDTHHHQSAELALSKLKQQGHQLVAAHFSDRAIDYRDIDFCKKTALVMGTELSGVSDKALALCDNEIVIPMMGMVESFNVSVAAAIILSEAQRQRQQAGFYQHQRIDDTAYQRLFFRWAYPKLTKFCDERGLAYPPLDENMDLIPGTAPA
ncbi:tRNA (guanosine(18)-2'-O)-methyltransferase TrmH [Agaribacterium haliotis]|uniref:tRNA (guanosine(18)-2'-O)-methyltransferase TrmH n=1 Tax=Agaribacterium haliotis TaxID=2013869 RepID=UPI000BB53DED|nr:tRNA (guanosine(18)-2'-O)-methyltransferase TrmH [Agaribacterium haliotis]